MLPDKLDKKHVFDTLLEDDPYNSNRPHNRHLPGFSDEVLSHTPQWDPFNSVASLRHHPPDEMTKLLVSKVPSRNSQNDPEYESL